jgi:type IV pilus assembly protein PilV
MLIHHVRTHNAQRGIALIESLVSLLLVAIGIIVLLNMQSLNVRNTSDAKYRSEAALLAQKRISEIFVNQENLSNYIELNTDISTQTALPGAKRSTQRATADCDSDASNIKNAECFVVTIQWKVPGTAETRSFVRTAYMTGGV